MKIEGSELFKFKKIDYTFPQPSLLTEGCEFNSEIFEERAEKAAKKILLIFKKFKVKADLKTCNVNPVFTRLIFGVEGEYWLRKLEEIQSEIMMENGKGTSMIFPVANNLIGIDIKNGGNYNLSLKKIVDSSEFKNYFSDGIKVALGIDYKMIPKVMKYSFLFNLLIGGKNIDKVLRFIDSIIVEQFYSCDPTKIKFLLIDTIGNKFQKYNNLPYLLGEQVFDENDDVNVILNLLKEEMHNRYSKFEDAFVFNSERYNSINDEKMCQIVIIVNDFSKISKFSHFKTIIENLSNFSFKGKTSGISVILGTSNILLKSDYLNNFNNRVCFKTESLEESEQFLGFSGAEYLSDENEVIFKGTNDVERLIVPLVTEKEIKNIVYYIKNR